MKFKQGNYINANYQVQSFESLKRIRINTFLHLIELLIIISRGIFVSISSPNEERNQSNDNKTDDHYKHYRPPPKSTGSAPSRVIVTNTIVLLFGIPFQLYGIVIIAVFCDSKFTS